MFANGQVNSFNEIIEVGLGAYVKRPGVTVTPGVSSANGSWAAWATPANDVYGIYINVNSGAVSATAKNHTIDIGVDPAGGTSYTVLMQDLICGNTSAADIFTQSRTYYFPLYIKGGSSIAIRARGSHTTAGTIKVYGRLYCRPSNPAALWAGTYCETIGYTSGTLGTTVVRVVLNKGSWTSLGTTTKNLKYFQVSGQTDNSVQNVGPAFVDLAYGDGTNFTIILSDVPAGGPWTTTEIEIQHLHVTSMCYANVPAGSTLYARATAITALTSGFNVVAVGIGG